MEGGRERAVDVPDVGVERVAIDQPEGLVHLPAHVHDRIRPPLPGRQQAQREDRGEDDDPAAVCPLHRGRRFLADVHQDYALSSPGSHLQSKWRRNEPSGAGKRQAPSRSGSPHRRPCRWTTRPSWRWPTGSVATTARCSRRIASRLAAHPALLAALPIDRVEPTPFQRDPSKPHVKRLMNVIETLGRFLDPIIAVRQGDALLDAQRQPPAAGDAQARARRRSSRSLVPDPDVAFKILALNTEKAHNLKEKSLETIRMAARARRRGSRSARERSSRFEFDQPAFLTLGAAYEERPRLSGGAYQPLLRRIDDFLDERTAARAEERERRAAKILAIDDEVGRIVEKLKKRGLTSPYLRPFVVARINPIRLLDLHGVRLRRRPRPHAGSAARNSTSTGSKQEDVVRAGGGGGQGGARSDRSAIRGARCAVLTRGARCVCWWCADLTGGREGRILLAASIRAQPRDSAPAGVLCEAKGGTLPDWFRRSFSVTTVRCWGAARGVPKGDTTMPRNKDLKRLVRARMQEDGRSLYRRPRADVEQPRAQLRADANASHSAAPVDCRPHAPGRPDYAAIAGMSDAKIKEKTGCTWERWVYALDRTGAAAKLSHGEIARAGQREVQGRRLVDADGHGRLRAHQGPPRAGTAARRQLRGEQVEHVQRARRDPVRCLGGRSAAKAVARCERRESAHVDRAQVDAARRTDRTIIVVGFMPKGSGKSAVAIQHTRLRDRATADRLKEYWSARLSALGALLAAR